jgi:hypothetical protein
MRAIELLLAQHQTIHDIFHMVIDDLTDDEWTGRVLPQANLPAADLWHVVRAYDTYINTAVRGVPQIYDREPWAALDVPADFGVGIDIPLAEADAIARRITRAGTAAYADAVWEFVRAWMATLSDDDLDTVPDVVANFAAHPRLGRPEYLALIEEHFGGRPMVGYFSGTCGGHRRDHLIEVDLTKQALRQRAGATAQAAQPSAAPELLPAAPALAVVGTTAAAPSPAPAGGRRWPWGRR